MLWRFEFRRHLPPFLVALALLGVPRLGMVVSSSDTLSILFGLCTMIGWTIFLTYAAYCLFDYYCLGSDILLHISTLSRRRILLVRSSVLYLFSLVLALATLIFSASLVKHPGTFASAGWIYLVLSRAVSLLAFFGVLMVILRLIKMLNQKMAMSVAYGISATVSVVGVAVGYWTVGAQSRSAFFLGVSDSYDHAPAYALALPFYDIGNVPFISHLSIVASVGNIIVAIVSMGLWWITSRSPRVNFFKV